MIRIKNLIILAVLCSSGQNVMGISFPLTPNVRTTFPISINEAYLFSGGCDTNQNNTIETAMNIMLNQINGGIACDDEGGDWFITELEPGYTFTANILDGQAQVWFNLYDATGSRLLAQDDERGNIQYSYNGDEKITLLLKAFNEQYPGKEIPYTFKPKIEKTL